MTSPSIIFDEHKYALKLLDNGFSKFMKYNDLFILAKYYRFMGFKTTQVRRYLQDFCEKFYPDYNDVIFGNKLDFATKKSEKFELRIPSEVFITLSEMEKIRSVKNYRLEKILFVMLMISRNNKIFRGNISEFYFVNENMSTIFALAKVYSTKKERNEIKHELYKLGFIEAIPANAKFDSNGKDNFRLFYADDKSEVDFTITDLDNMVLFYKPVCEVCGKEIEKKNNRHKMCSDCWKEKHRILNMENMRKSRKDVYV